MSETASLLAVFGEDPELAAQLSQLIMPYGWHLRFDKALSVVGDVMRSDRPAAIVLAGPPSEQAAAVAVVRALRDPDNGTPILTTGKDVAAPAGAGGHLSLPLEDLEFLDILRRWAGPLDDHALRTSLQGPYRLIRLVGYDNASAMLDRFAAALHEAIATAGEDPAAVPAHRLAGIAGMVGFAELNELWARVDRREPGALNPAVEASRRTLRDIEKASPRL
jgi:hypothetical protein